MSICKVDSRLIWNLDDIVSLTHDISRVAGRDRRKEFEIILVPVLDRMFMVKIQGPEEYRALIEKMSNQEIV